MDKHIERGFIVPFWDKITKALTYISILNCIIYFWRKRYNMDTELKDTDTNGKLIREDQLFKMYRFIELWVFHHTFLAVVSSIAIYYILDKNNFISLYIILFYALIRIFEIVIYQLRVVIFDGVGKKALLKGARRSILLLIHNIVEIVFWYASITMILISLNLSTAKLHELESWNDFIKSSALFITTYGDDYTSVAKAAGSSKLLAALVFWEVLCGFIMVIVSFARFLSLIPNPDLIDEKNEKNKRTTQSPQIKKVDVKNIATQNNKEVAATNDT